MQCAVQCMSVHVTLRDLSWCFVAFRVNDHYISWIMDNEVTKWLEEEDLSDLIDTFISKYLKYLK